MSVEKNEIKPGDYVTYITEHKLECGRVKEIRDNGAMVVYMCNEEWENFRNYTAALTPFEYLYPGWPL